MSCLCSLSVSSFNVAVTLISTKSFCDVPLWKKLESVWVTRYFQYEEPVHLIMLFSLCVKDFLIKDISSLWRNEKNISHVHRQIKYLSFPKFTEHLSWHGAWVFVLLSLYSSHQKLYFFFITFILLKSRFYIWEQKQENTSLFHFT